MFEQSLVEISSETKVRKCWTAMVSYSLETLAVLIVLSTPLVHTEALPLNDTPTIHPPTRYVRPHVDLVPPPERQASARPEPIHIFQQPDRIPGTIDRTPDPPAPAYGRAANDDIGEGAIPVNDLREPNPVLESMLRRTIPAPVHTVTAPVLRPSKAEESLLIRQIKPSYPPIAIQTRTQGPVVMQAIIARDGTIQQLRVVSGHPLLVRAAVEAVRQWRYRPFLLNGEPMEVDTQITVNFTLNGN